VTTKSLRDLLKGATAPPWKVSADNSTVNGYDVKAGESYVSTWCTNEEAQLIVGAINHLELLLDVAESAELFMSAVETKPAWHDINWLIETRDRLRLALERWKVA
jgi:hypothetical protein